MSKKLSFEDFNTISELFHVYGSLLTNKQQEILEAYFGYNLSLREIAENLSISSSAIHDTIQKCVVKMQRYEEYMGLVKTKSKLSNLQADIKDNKVSQEELLEKVKEINNGI